MRQVKRFSRLFAVAPEKLIMNLVDRFVNIYNLRAPISFAQLLDFATEHAIAYDKNTGFPLQNDLY